MRDLRREFADRCQSLGLKQTLFERLQIGAVLKYVDKLPVITGSGYLYREIHQLPLSCAGKHQQGSVSNPPFANRLPADFPICFRSRTERLYRRTLQSNGGSSKNVFRGRRDVENRTVEGGHQHSFMHASDALLGIEESFPLLQNV